MNWPKISVVTPSYNQADYLRDAMESVLRQDYPSMEYIVIDGGSTDDSRRIIEEYADRLTYYVSEPDKGQSDALRKGFERATGQVLGWLNSDDMLFPGALRRMGRAFALRPWADIVAGEFLYVDAAGRAGRYSSPPLPRFWNWRDDVMRIGQPATYFRRRAYERVGGVRLDLSFKMDNDLWRRMLNTGARGHVIYSPVAMFRLQQEGKQGDPVGREEEQRRVHREYGITPTGRRLALWKMQALRLVDGSHLKSYWKMLRLRGKTAQGLWTDYEDRL